MKKVRWVSATAGPALVAAMFALPGAGVAHASDNGNTTGNGNVPAMYGQLRRRPAGSAGTTTTTTVSTGTSPSSLPTTGADLLLLGVAALGSIGVARVPSPSPGVAGTARSKQRGLSRTRLPPQAAGDTVRGFPSYSPSGGSRARGGYERGVCASGIHALFSWLLLCRLRMCGLGV